MFRSYIDRFRDILRRPEEELTRLEARVRWATRLVVHCYRELVRVRAQGMAAELTYRTIFSLIPVVVLGLVMFRVVGGLDEFRTTVEKRLYNFFGVPHIPEVYGIDPAESDVIVEPPAFDEVTEMIEAEIEDREAYASIRRALSQAAEQVMELDFASLGIIGLLLFIYTAVALSDSVEELFNLVYQAPSERPLHIRLAIHWSIITLGSGLLALSLYLSGQVVDYFQGAVRGTTPARLLNFMLSALAGWILLFLLYALMPNTHVSLRAAAVGSAVGAGLWEIAKFGFQLYVISAVPYSALYGSLGLIPLFLFWIYVTWIIVLFGLVLTHTLQSLHGRDLPEVGVSPAVLPSGDPTWMLPLLLLIRDAFRRGESLDQEELAERLQLPSVILQSMLQRLEAHGWVARLAAADDRDESYTLARPDSSIGVRDILHFAHELPEEFSDPAWRTLEVFRAAQCDAAGDLTLADLPPADPPTPDLPAGELPRAGG